MSQFRSISGRCKSAYEKILNSGYRKPEVLYNYCLFLEQVRRDYIHAAAIREELDSPIEYDSSELEISKIRGDLKTINNMRRMNLIGLICMAVAALLAVILLYPVQAAFKAASKTVIS